MNLHLIKQYINTKEPNVTDEDILDALQDINNILDGYIQRVGTLEFNSPQKPGYYEQFLKSIQKLDRCIGGTVLPTEGECDCSTTPDPVVPIISCEGATDSLYLRVLLNRVEFGGKFTVYDAESNAIIVNVDGTAFTGALDFVEALNINPDYINKLDFITFAPTSYYADNSVEGIFQIKNIHTSNIRLNVDVHDMGSGQNNLTTLGILVLQPNTPALVFNENDFNESKYNLSACLSPAM